MTDVLLYQEDLDASEELPEASQDYLMMLADIVEYELNFLDFPTVIAMVKRQLKEKYEKYTYDELNSAYNQIFGDV